MSPRHGGPPSGRTVADRSERHSGLVVSGSMAAQAGSGMRRTARVGRTRTSSGGCALPSVARIRPGPVGFLASGTARHQSDRVESPSPASAPEGGRLRKERGAINERLSHRGSAIGSHTSPLIFTWTESPGSTARSQPPTLIHPSGSGTMNRLHLKLIPSEGDIVQRENLCHPIR